MKTQLFILIFAVLSLSFYSCEEDDIESAVDLVSTASMTATVDQTEWKSITRVSKFFTTTNSFVLSGTSTDGRILAVTVRGTSTGSYSTSIDSLTAQVGVIYRADSKYFISSSGQVEITALDTAAKKISGTFNFEIVNADSLSEKYSISAGRFDNLSYSVSDEEESRE